MYDACKAAAESSVSVCGEGGLEGRITRENLLCVAGDTAIIISDLERGLFFPIQEMDALREIELSGSAGEMHIVENDAIVDGGVEISKLVQSAHQEWCVEAVNCPLCLACTGTSPHVQCVEVISEWQQPHGSWVVVLVWWRARAILSE